MAGRATSGPLRGLQDLRSRVEASGPPPVVLFLGDDRREADAALQWLEERVLEPGFEAFNLLRLRGSELTAAEVVDAASTLPLGSRQRLVVLREPEKLRGGPDAIADYAASPCPSTCLVLVPAALDRRTRFAKALEQAACVVRFEPPAAHELEAWVSRALEARGVTMAPDALALLHDLVQAETLLLGNELEKLALYCGPGGTVQRGDVESLLGRTRAVEVFDLTNAIEDGDAARAVSVLRRLLGQGAAVPLVVGMLDWCLGRLVSAEPPKAPPFRRDAILARRRALAGRAAEIHGLLLEADRTFRSSGGDAAAALERTVLAACR